MKLRIRTKFIGILVIAAVLPFTVQVVDAVQAFIAPASPSDDICLVTVEVTAAPAKPAASPQRLAVRQ